MDRERKKRVQTARLIVTEIVMVFVVIIAVVILTFVAMGYNVNKDGEFGQSGLVQIKSIPVGANIKIDQESIIARTNTNRMLAPGEHTIELTKDGYDTWHKTIVSEAGWLLKLDYPRLFYQDRNAEKIYDYPADIPFFVVAPNREQVLYKVSALDEWQLLNVKKSNEISNSTLMVADLIEQRDIISLKWNENSDKVLVESANNGEIEWILLNLRDLSESINLSRTFGMRFSAMDFATDNGEKIIAVENGNLRTVAVSAKTISQVLASNVKYFFNSDDQIIYLTNGNEMLIYQDGGKDIVLAQYPLDQEVKLAFGEYLNKKQLVVVVGSKMLVYVGDFPSEDNNLEKMELIAETELPGASESLIVHTHDELFVAKVGRDLAVYDAELSKLSQFTIEGDNYYFLDDYLIATNYDDRMIVCDFDGENRRELVNTAGNGFIAKDEKYLYYVKTDRSNTSILREKIIE